MTDRRRSIERLLFWVPALALLPAACTTGGGDDGDAALAALMSDGDPSAVAPGAMTPPPPLPPPSRFCPSGDCARDPLAFWRFDDCNTLSTQLADTAFTSPISHPAFRAVSVACVAGIDAGAIQLAAAGDIAYAPDQPDFLFDHGLTVAAWIKPDSIAGLQTIVRKRFDGSSAFLLAIVGRKLTFAVQLASGRFASASAAIPAGTFTHVAATYDGQNAILYVNGAVAAKAQAAGTLAAGVGPIFVGNDATGRQFKGIVDDVWLNTLAAPADVILGLTCIRKPPVVALTPGTTPPTPPGTPVAFDLAITNPNGPSCPVDSFEFFASGVGFPLQPDQFAGVLSVAPGQTAHATINVSALPGGPTGPFPFSYTVADLATFNLQASAQATFVVAAPPPPTRTGCAPMPTAPVAPGGYYVNGNTVCTPDGRAHLFHGVDRPSLEWSSAGQNLSKGDFALMGSGPGSWNANVVRIALNQDFWLAGSPLADPSYPDTVSQAIAWAEMAGMDVILDLHWSDQGVLGSCVSTPTMTCQQLMPDANSLTFWSQVAARYQGDGRVMFELYNEPHDVSWDVWRNGGDTGAGWKAVGMQQLYDAVRATGAQNLVLIGGLNWAYDLSGVPANRVKGYNIVYATHPYGTPDGFTRPPSDWDRAWGSLTATDPVVATEFGVLNDTACTTGYDQQVITYADAHSAGWTAWAWYPGGCTFPAVINDWAGTPSPTGMVVKAALGGYHDPPASPPLPGGGGPDLAYTFDSSVQGWSFNTYDDPNQQNLAVHPPAGGAPPTLAFDSTDGSPDPGALRVTVDFEDFNQYVDANINFAPPGLNLTGKVLHARIKLVSGAFPQGAFQLHASTGSSYTWGAVFFNASALPPGQWVDFDLDLGAVTSSGYDPSQVVQIGVQLLSGLPSGGGTFMSPGTAVFDIDTVTD